MTDTTTAVPDVTPAPATSGLQVLPKFATTPTKGRVSKRQFKGARALVDYARANGNRVVLTDPQTIQALEANGLPKESITTAVFEARRYFGLDIKSERTGRTVTSLTF